MSVPIVRWLMPCVINARMLCGVRCQMVWIDHRLFSFFMKSHANEVRRSTLLPSMQFLNIFSFTARVSCILGVLKRDVHFIHSWNKLTIILKTIQEKFLEQEMHRKRDISKCRSRGLRACSPPSTLSLFVTRKVGLNWKKKSARRLILTINKNFRQE